MNNSPSTISEWHELLLSKLIAYRATHPEFTFSPRRTNDDRFKAGYWFQGNEDYLFCAPFKFNEPNNKTKTIGLVLVFDGVSLVSAAYEVVFGAPNCQAHLPFYKELLSQLGSKFEEGRWKYKIPTPSLETDKLVDDFLIRVVPEITKLIEKYGYQQEYVVTQNELESSLKAISERKAAGLQPLQAKSNTQPIQNTQAPSSQAWLVGAYWDGEDMTPTFVNESRWQNGYEDRFLDQVKAVKEGDRIAIKTSYVQRHNLPFSTDGRAISCMQIKARGIVKGNPGDGRSLSVEWEKGFKPFVIYHFTYRSTISRIDGEKYPEVVRWIFLGEIQPVSGHQSTSGAQSDDSELLLRYGPVPRNLIFFGPPGTGKTRALLEEILPAYTDDPEVEPEDLRLERITNGLGWFETLAAVLIDANGSHLRVPEIRKHRFVEAKLRNSEAGKNLNQVIWGVLQTHTVLGSQTVNSNQEKRVEPLVFDKDDSSQWSLVSNAKQIAPELWENYLKLTKTKPGSAGPIERYELVTFHPSYSYEDFVEGLRPVPVEQDDGTNAIEILPRDGVLKRLCKRAKDDPDHRYALVIDEVNRGNIAKIFGELITLVEADKRVRYEGDNKTASSGVEVVLPCTGQKFGVPDNIDIYATMNTADRSIALVDIALRRRFTFREVLPEPDVIEGADGEGTIDGDDENGPIDLRKLLKVLNARLAILRGRDSCIGHAYFTKVTDIEGLRATFRDCVIPLLQEYFYEDWEGISRVLTVKKGAAQFIEKNTPNIAGLFGPSASDMDYLCETPAWRLAQSLTETESPNIPFPADSFRSLYSFVDDKTLNG